MSHTKEQIRSYIKNSVENIEPVDEQEIRDKKSIKNYLVLHPDNFYDRQNFKGHIIASGLVFYDKQIVLVYDEESGRWLRPGGHCLEDEMPFEAAQRKIEEKVSFEQLKPKHQNEEGQPLPFYCDTYEVPEKNEDREHKHLNILYVYEAKNLQIKPEYEEGVKLFDQKEAERVNPTIKKIILKMAGKVII